MMKKSKTLLIALCATAAVVAFGGCATSGALVCRQDPLLHPEMRYDDATNNSAIDDHVYVSKEASSGGRAVGGGGCGCN